MQDIEKTVADWFKQNNFHWSLLNKGRVVPDEADVESVLDEAARVLYNEPPGTYLSVGRLIIERTESGHNVYMFIGSYE